MGVEKLDNSVYLIRGLYDLADMARSKHDGRTYSWARNLARKLHDRFEATWWMAAVPQHADSIDDPPVGGPNNQQQDQHWIGVTPMEAELTIGGDAAPGLTTRDHGNQALALRETDCYSGQRPYNLGLFHTGCTGGRMGLASARSSASTRPSRRSARATTAGSVPGSSSATPTLRPSRCSASRGRAELPTSSPGHCPRSSRHRTSTDRARATPTSTAAGPAARCSCRPGGTTAPPGRWSTSSSACGPTWAGAGSSSRRRYRQGQSRVAGRNIRLAGGAVNVAASQRWRHLPDRGQARAWPCSRFVIGHTLPRGSHVKRVWLDGRRAGYRTRATNRGLEVLVRAPASGRHELVVTDALAAHGEPCSAQVFASSRDLGQPEAVPGRVTEPASRCRTGAPPESR